MKRSCLLVLSNVPHSDDMSDDPLKYLAAQIQSDKTVQQAKTIPERTSASVQRADAVYANSVTQHILDLSTNTASPSESSYRATLSTQDYSTPLTSAGLTPGQSARRFSDAARKSCSSTKKPGSSLRNESQIQTKSRATSNAGGHMSTEATNTSSEAEAIKRTLRLVTDGHSRPHSGASARSMDNANTERSPVPDLNKSLPPPPPEPVSVSDDQKQIHISRLMKTIRKKKSMTTAEGSRGLHTTSKAQRPPPPPTTRVASKPTARDPAAPNAQASKPRKSQPSEPAPTKKRFRLRLFTRRHHRPADVLVS